MDVRILAIAVLTLLHAVVAALLLRALRKSLRGGDAGPAAGSAPEPTGATRARQRQIG